MYLRFGGLIFGRAYFCGGGGDFTVCLYRLYKLFLYGRILFLRKQSPGGGKLSLSACLGVGNRTSSEEKIANPGGVPRGNVNLQSGTVFPGGSRWKDGKTTFAPEKKHSKRKKRLIAG